LFALGCDLGHTQTLTREKAKAPLEASEIYQKPPYIPLTQSLQKAGYRYWDIISFTGSHPPGRCATPEMYTVCLTQAGLRFFNEISGGEGMFGVTKPIQVAKQKFDLRLRVIAIDGITTAPTEFGAGAKMAVYRWNYDLSRAPGEMRALFSDEAETQGRAIFLLYDDGWRFERIIE